MNILARAFSRVFGSKQPRTVRRFAGAVQAARKAHGAEAWAGTSDEYFNQEYMQSLPDVIKRAQDLDVNNPDVHGFHRMRTAQCVGKGVFFKSEPKPEEVNLKPEVAQEVAQQINRVKRLHSRLGGFDASGRGYSEGKQQERAILTMFINGRCLIHRVYNADRKLPVPFSVELIPGSRLTTPYAKSGDPHVSFGIQYSDEYRTRIVGFWVRKVPRTMGNSFVAVPEWDYIPAEDAVMLSLTEMAGLDQALPLVHPLVRMLRNRGEFIEKAVETARTQANYFAQIECAPGVNPWTAADDDRDQVNDAAASDSTLPSGFMSINGVQVMYSPAGEKVNWNNARLPDPDFTGFMDATDQRCARGFVTSTSRFTRNVNGSWAGGRMEEQQDDPVVDQLRESFTCAWQRVHEWFIEACWLAGAVEIPGYSNETRPFWTEYRAEFPGKVDINPQDTAKARQIQFSLRTLTPQQACESEGKDLHTNLQQWAEALVAVRQAEKDHGLTPGSLDFIVESKASDLSSGDDVNATGDAQAEKKVSENNKRRFEHVSLNSRRANAHV